MSPKLSLQTLPNIHPGKVESHQLELSKLRTAQHEAELRLSSLRQFQHELLGQLKNTQRGKIELSNLTALRMNILQVNSHIENITLELARLNQQLKEKKRR